MNISNILTGLSGAQGLIDGFTNNSSIKDTGLYKNRLSYLQSYLPTSNNNLDLLSEWNTFTPMSTLNYNQVGKSLADNVIGIGKSALHGASLGSIIPGVGTAIGAGVGTLIGGIGSLFGVSKAKSHLNDINSKITNANRRVYDLMANRSKIIEDNMDNSMAKNFYGLGGNIASPPFIAPIDNLRRELRPLYTERVLYTPKGKAGFIPKEKTLITGNTYSPHIAIDTVISPTRVLYTKSGYRGKSPIHVIKGGYVEDGDLYKGNLTVDTLDHILNTAALDDLKKTAKDFRKKYPNATDGEVFDTAYRETKKYFPQIDMMLKQEEMAKYSDNLVKGDDLFQDRFYTNKDLEELDRNLRYTANKNIKDKTTLDLLDLATVPVTPKKVALDILDNLGFVGLNELLDKEAKQDRYRTRYKAKELLNKAVSKEDREVLGDIYNRLTNKKEVNIWGFPKFKAETPIRGKIEDNMTTLLDELNPLNKLAFGGYTDTTFPEKLKEFNAGGTHANNPYGGIQIGIGANGKPNTVEEGETEYNGYIFSNRLTPYKGSLSMLGLPNINKSYADISKKLAKEAKERPNDPISKRGLEHSMSLLRDSQEYTKEQLEIDSINKDILELTRKGIPKEETEAMVINNRTNQFQNGGDTLKSLYGKTKPELEEEEGESPLGDVIQGLVLGSLLGASGVKALKKFGDVYPKKYHSMWKTAGENIKNKSKKAAQYINKNKGKAGFGTLLLGGASLVGTGIHKAIVDHNNETINDKQDAAIEDTRQRGLRILQTIKNRQRDQRSYIDSLKMSPDSIANREALDWLNNTGLFENVYASGGSLLRYLPVAATGLMSLTDTLGLTNKPDYSDAAMVSSLTNSYTPYTYSPISQRASYTPIDTDYLGNRMLNQVNSTSRNILNTYGNNPSAALSGLLSLSNTSLGQLGELNRQAREYNQAKRDETMRFNTGIDQSNMQMSMQAQQANNALQSMKADILLKGIALRDKEAQAASLARSTNLSNFINSLAGLGQEEYNRNAIRGMYRGYSIDNKGRVGYANTPKLLSDVLGNPILLSLLRNKTK